MKKSVLVSLVVIFSSVQLFAQSNDDYIEIVRDVLKTEKKVAIAEVMALSDTESGPFWELYNEYNFEMSKVQNQRVSLIKDFAANYENMTDEKADELWKGTISFQQQALKLKKKYYGKFKKIMPAGRAAMYFQAENKIEALINASLALEIPFIETK
jgi:sorbitol-specific phosphotransferase system component IIBC